MSDDVNERLQAAKLRMLLGAITPNETRQDGPTDFVLREVWKERQQQDRNRGGWITNMQQDPWVQFAVLIEEVGEVGTEMMGLVSMSNALRQELIQVAAVAVAFVELLDYQRAQVIHATAEAAIRKRGIPYEERHLKEGYDDSD